MAAADSEAAAQPEPAPLVPVQLTPQRMQMIGVTTGHAEVKQIHDEIRVTGSVEVDEEKLAYVQLRFPGWIQKVYANAAYQYLRMGQPLFTIYSPDVSSTEQEYVLAQQNRDALAQGSSTAASEANWLLEATAERLRQMQVPPAEIERLNKTGKVEHDIAIISPVSGYITERNALPNMYVQPETKLYTVADFSTMWVFAQVFQSDLGRIKRGDPALVTVDAYPGQVFRGRVDFIYPDVDMNTRTARVRLVFSNSDLKLKPGMYVNIRLQMPMGRQLVVPASAVFHSGTRNLVFIDAGPGRASAARSRGRDARGRRFHRAQGREARNLCRDFGELPTGFRKSTASRCGCLHAPATGCRRGRWRGCDECARSAGND